MFGRDGSKMTTLVERRKSAEYVYLHLINEEDDLYSVKKLPIDKYEYALRLCGREDPEFLYKVGIRTHDRDIWDSYHSVKF